MPRLLSLLVRSFARSVGQSAREPPGRAGSSSQSVGQSVPLFVETSKVHYSSTLPINLCSDQFQLDEQQPARSEMSVPLTKRAVQGSCRKMFSPVREELEELLISERN